MWTEARKKYKREYDKTPMGRYIANRHNALGRGIAWELSFDEWLNVWEASGKFHERGRHGYHLCRHGDVGAYKEDNVYIDTASNNKSAAYANGRTVVPTKAQKHRKVPTEKLKEIIAEATSPAKIKELAEKYNITTSYIYNLRCGRFAS